MYGPAKIGETVETIAMCCRFRGTLVDYSGSFAYIAVLGYSNTIQVPRESIVPIREF